MSEVCLISTTTIIADTPTGTIQNILLIHKKPQNYSTSNPELENTKVSDLLKLEKNLPRTF